MNIESIDQELLHGSHRVITKVVFSRVESQCILARLAIQALGRPGVDTDLSFVGSGNQWILMWSYPTLSLEAAQALMAEMMQSTDQNQAALKTAGV